MTHSNSSASGITGGRTFQGAAAPSSPWRETRGNPELSLSDAIQQSREITDVIDTVLAFNDGPKDLAGDDSKHIALKDAKKSFFSSQRLEGSAKLDLQGLNSLEMSVKEKGETVNYSVYRKADDSQAMTKSDSSGSTTLYFNAQGVLTAMEEKADDSLTLRRTTWHETDDSFKLSRSHVPLSMAEVGDNALKRLDELDRGLRHLQYRYGG